MGTFGFLTFATKDLAEWSAAKPIFLFNGFPYNKI
jgi:hypothetical protein